MKKTLITILIAVSLAAGISPVASALVEQSEDFFVTDAANVLTEATRQEIIESNIGLMELCQGAQIVIVTVRYLDGMYADEYATQLFNEWGVGSTEADNGMLLLLATEEARGGLVVGAGIAGAFTAEMREQYLNTHFWPEVDARNFDTAVRNMCEALFSWFADYYGITFDADHRGQTIQRPEPSPQEHWYYCPSCGHAYYTESDAVLCYQADRANQRMSLIVFGVIFVLLIVIFIVMSAGNDRRRHRMYYSRMGMPIPPYHWWFLWGARPYRTWYRSHYRHNNWRGGPRGPGGFGGPGRPGGRPPSSFGGSGGRSSGGFGGFGGTGGRSGGGFGGFGGSGRGGGFGGGFGGGGGRSGGFGGRR